MRVSPRELQAVRRAGMLTRYALLGPVAYALADFPPEGTTGTELDEPCVRQHHGIVLRGELRTHHEDGRVDRFGPGTAFYVPAGPPSHTFSWATGTVAGGFVALTPDVETSPEALRRRGFEVVRRPPAPDAPPTSVTLAGVVEPFRRRGAIDVEGSVMGPWVVMRSTFGPQSGFGAGWCDLPHWGIVLKGDVAIYSEDDVELVSAGEAFLAPAGHRFETPDGATVLDYTPIDEISSARRIVPWRRAVVNRVLGASERSSPVPPATEEARPVREHRPVLRLRPGFQPG